ncbi:MAG TPA: acetylglutamate kinase [Planctomycetota bacterium]|jgi:acetylglutamate kinase|nr:acetylglutamate kinase [Planctomycetota bacterium]
MTMDSTRSFAITAIRAAIPYLRLFQGKTFVIKASGEVFTDRASTKALMEQVGVLHQLGIQVVVVHGGGGQATQLASDLGLQTRMVEGRRVTDAKTLQVATMVLNGTVNTDIVAVCRELGIPALGLSGVDAGLIRARRRPPRQIDGHGLVDYGFVGDIVSVDINVLERLLKDRFVPIMSPLSANDEGEVLNINADIVAARLAKEVKAEKLILVTSVPGILKDVRDPESLVSYTDVRGLKDLEDTGAIAGGMLPKVASIKDALYGGVARVHVIPSRVKDSLLQEVFTNEGCGTLVVLDTKELRPEETVATRCDQILKGGPA